MRIIRTAVACAVFVVLPLVAAAQADLTGKWQNREHEDFPERGEGPRVGDYQGIPINDAGRARAEAWTAEIWSVPEHQCIPHAADYLPNSRSNLRVWSDVDPVTSQVFAWHMQMSFGMMTRTIWMDGRPHPPEYTPHTWGGFSTGKWEGDMLTVTTTHLKAAPMYRNGLARSHKGMLTEHFVRNGDLLTWISITEDPGYLAEPYIKSRSYVYHPYLPWNPYTCSPEAEVDRDQTMIPHYLPGANPFLNESAAAQGIPVEGRAGGPETTYPEFAATLKTLPPATYTPVLAPGARPVGEAAAPPAPAVTNRPAAPAGNAGGNTR